MNREHWQRLERASEEALAINLYMADTAGWNWAGMSDMARSSYRTRARQIMAGEFDDAYPDEPEPKVPLLEGEIKLGEVFIWEPHKPYAYARVEVIAIEGDPKATMWDRRVQTRDVGSGKTNWNEESRFREACVRAK